MKNRPLHIQSAALFVTVIASLVAIEFASRFLLQRYAQKKKPLFLNRVQYAPRAANEKEFPQMDPHLGYNNSPTFTSYGPAAPGGLRIVALGGSTTDPFVQPKNWPRALQTLTSQRGFSVQVFNGGVGGYSSNQELLKCVRDAFPLKPHIIIGLHGINDLGLFSVENHKMVHTHQTRLFDSFIDPVDFVFPNTMGLTRFALGKVFKISPPKLTLGNSDHSTPVERWQKNIRLMHSMAGELGIAYLSFLQPTVGVGSYTPDDREKAMFEEMHTRWQSPGGYIGSLESFFPQAKTMCKELEFCTDITEIFKGRTSMYDDPRHPTPTGYEIIAQKMLRVIEEKGLLRARFSAG